MTVRQPESITDDLRADILAGTFQPGQRLVEAQLTERYQCGRATVRAAFVELDGEGLVDREANRGARVRSISVDEAIQITEARAALESLCAVYAARLSGDEERQALQETIDAMDKAVAADDQDAYARLNSIFHRQIRDFSHREVAARLVEQLRNQAAAHQYRLARRTGRAAVSLEQHRAIAQAVIDGDEHAAAEAMRAHLMSVIETLRQW